MEKIKNKHASHSLKFNIWLYFLYLIAFIAILMWLLQIVFFNQFYLRFKEKEIRRIGEILSEEYKVEDFGDRIFRKTNYGSIPVRVFNRKGIASLSSSILELATPDPLDIILFIEPLIEDDEQEVFHIVEDPSVNGSQYMVYGRLLKISEAPDENIYLYIISQLASMDNTASVLKEQLVLITILSLIFAIILSFFIASKLVKPITQLTDAAGLLAEENYNIKFEGGGYSEIDKLSQALNYATNELSKTDKLRRELISNVSHEIRTPLTMIKAYAEMIRDISGANEEKRKNHINTIINESNRLSDLVNDILDISRYESGTFEINCSETNISDLISKIVTNFRVMYQNEGFTFHLDCDENTIIYADETKIQQVLYNLIVNAINYTGENKTIYISLKNKEDKMRFEVIDTGKGIPEEKIDRIWDRFYRAGEYYNRNTVGSGLGLSIVKNILTIHNAEFGVISLVKGCMFWFEMDKL
ncbi:MAG: ATP-binding protein [Tissierellia bacterium]|nr:ATP-binding protein [Tissierellia bacterium]